MENKKVLLSLKNVEVKFHVRGRILTAIRGISMDIYENESIAIVGESGSGKSVLTKTFAGMLDSNGFISNGSIALYDDELSKTEVKMTKFNSLFLKRINSKLDKSSKYEFASKNYNNLLEIKAKKKVRVDLSSEEHALYDKRISDLEFDYTEAFNYIQTLDKSNQKDEYLKTKDKMLNLKNQIKSIKKERINHLKEHKREAKLDKAFYDECRKNISLNKAEIKELICKEISQDSLNRNKVISKEILLSIGRYPLKTRIIYALKILSSLKNSMKQGKDLLDETTLNDIFDKTVFRVKYLRDESREEQKDSTKKESKKSNKSSTVNYIVGYANIDLAKIKYTRDWQQIRGCRISTVFQDPMTSLNPIIPIGKQIMNIIIKHQKCSEEVARKRAIEMMEKVGIPEAETRFNEYPFQYSGGMRQRIVIAIALSCQPKILICDEPTTALDVTIQAQILKLIKDLQHELKFTTVYITHDLGVVANVADRVAVLYAGQVVEVGNVDEIFYDPKHPYTWALLSSLPQLSEKGEKLFAIRGTPPSLYNKIKGDAFAPRNEYCLAIDLEEEPPYFKVSETHYAKTWLLDPRAPKVEKPKIIQNIHEKLSNSYINLSGK